MKNMFILSLALALLTECSGSKTNNSDSDFNISEIFTRDSNVVQISPEEFEKLKNLENGGCSYMGFGEIEDVGRMSRVDFLEPKFEAILYHRKDSIIYLRGVLNSSDVPYSYGQIIIGRIPKLSPPSYKGKVHLQYAYTLPKSGKFAVAIPVKEDSLQIVFAARDMLPEDGGYRGIVLAYIKTYDLYKLCGIYKPE